MEYVENYELKGLFNTSLTFNSTVEFLKYVDGQISNFTSIQNDFFKGKSSTINNIIARLNNLKPHINAIINTINSNNPINNQQRVNVQAHINELAKCWVPFDHPIFERLKYISDSYGAAGEQAFWTTATGGYFQPNNHYSMMGTLSAYDFLYERRTISEVSNTEREFIERNYSIAIEKGNELEAERKSLGERITNWENERHDSWEEWENSCNSSWQTLTENKNREWEADKIEFSKEHAELLAASTKKLSELEVTYQEHLKLEKPAEYWSKSAKKYDDSSSLWFGILVVLILAGLAGFSHFYSVYLSGQDSGVNLDTVKGIVLFVSGITIYGFLIRVVAKMLMSATHLQRDSEERAQLTYFYLALIKDGAIDEKSRDIVIQSLFSRTETGLISGDSSPTMPAMDVLKNIKIGGS